MTRALALRVAVLAALAGCAAAPRAPVQEAPGHVDAPSEIRALEARIAVRRQELGLSGETDHDAAALSVAPAATDRCRKVAEAADEICHAAARICVLADELAASDARRACTQAQGDCREARTVERACR